MCSLQLTLMEPDILGLGTSRVIWPTSMILYSTALKVNAIPNHLIYLQRGLWTVERTELIKN